MRFFALEQVSSREHETQLRARGLNSDGAEASRERVNRVGKFVTDGMACSSQLPGLYFFSTARCNGEPVCSEYHLT